MKKSFLMKILTIVVVAVITIGIIALLSLQQKNEVSVSESGGATGVIINEVMSSNSGFMPDDVGDFVDWIELYNPTNQDISLYGYGLSDDETEAIKYAMPDITIKAGGYLVVFASDKAISKSDSPVHTNFKLSSKGDVVILSNSAGQFLDRMEVVSLSTNVSYGRNASDVTVLQTFESPTPGYSNDEAGLAAFMESKIVENPELIITEVMTSNSTTLADNTGEFSDWIEIYNASSETVNLIDYFISDDRMDPYNYRFSEYNLKSGEYLLLFASGDLTNNAEKLKDGMHVPFRLSGYKDSVVLSNTSGQVLDSVDMREVPSDFSYMRKMNGNSYSDEWENSLLVSPGYVNDEQGRARFESENKIVLSDIIISEVMISNFSYVQEADGEYYDWIELYNRSDHSVELSGYGLTNNTANPGKWRFPAETLGAGEYIIVQASGLGQTMTTAAELKKKYLHTNYRLSIDGEIIALFDRNDRIIDRYNIDAIRSNTSIGRQNGENLLIFPVPTPATMNTGGVTGYAQIPLIDKQFGVYDQSITVSIDVPKDSVCYYTLDGSTPTMNSDIYEQSITIEQTTPFRVVTYKDLYMPSEILSGCYFIGVNHTVDIISIITDPFYLWDDKKGIYSLGSGIDQSDPRLGGSSAFVDVGDGISLYDYNRADDGDPETLYDRDVAKGLMVNANFSIKDFEVPANFSFYIDGQQVFEQNIGIQLFGSWSRYEVQKSFSIYARGKYGESSMEYAFFDNRPFTEYESIVARQSGQDCKFSRVKDIFITSLMETESDIEVQAYRQCVLYLNGKYWGIYNLREKSNKNFAEARYFAPNPEDNIDFLKGNGTVLTGSNEDYRALEDFMDNNDINIQENYDYVKSQMDVYNFMDWLIAEVYFVNSDDGNRKFYRVRSDDGLWRWILFDMDWAMWNAAGESKPRYEWNYIEEVINPKGTGAGNTFSTSVARGLMENEEWKRAFLERYAYLLDTAFKPEFAVPFLTSLRENIQDEVESECEVFNWSSVGFDKTVQDMENFLLNRPQYAMQYLQETLEISDDDMVEIFGN